MPIPSPAIGVRFTGLLTPTSTADTYAVYETWYGRGGFKRAVDITERNSITPDRREQNITFCYVESTGRWYQLVGGIADTDWVDIGTSLGGGGSSSTLQQITDNGNTTTNPILIQTGSTTVVGLDYFFTGSINGRITVGNSVNSTAIILNPNGIVFQSTATNQQYTLLPPSSISAFTFHSARLQNKTGTLAYLDDVTAATSSLTLQQVTNNGNITNIPITVFDSGFSNVEATLSYGVIRLSDTTTSQFTDYGIDGILYSGNGLDYTYYSESGIFRNFGSNGFTLNIPQSPTGVFTQNFQESSGTIALLSDITNASLNNAKLITLTGQTLTVGNNTFSIPLGLTTVHDVSIYRFNGSRFEKHSADISIGTSNVIVNVSTLLTNTKIIFIGN